MKLDISRDEAQLLMACLTALEREVSPNEPVALALADLRRFRSHVLEQWLREGLAAAEKGKVVQ